MLCYLLAVSREQTPTFPTQQLCSTAKLQSVKEKHEKHLSKVLDPRVVYDEGSAELILATDGADV